jgi:hypothetical protein
MRLKLQMGTRRLTFDFALAVLRFMARLNFVGLLDRQLGRTASMEISSQDRGANHKPSLD